MKIVVMREMTREMTRENVEDMWVRWEGGLWHHLSVPYWDRDDEHRITKIVVRFKEHEDE